MFVTSKDGNKERESDVRGKRSRIERGVDRGEKKETGDQERWHTGRRGRALAWLTLRFFLFPHFTSPLSKNTFSTRRKKKNKIKTFSFFQL
jgi:hypothetical protein